MTDEIYNALSDPAMQELMDMVLIHNFLPLSQSPNLMQLRRLHSEHFQVPEFALNCSSCIPTYVKQIHDAYKQMKAGKIEQQLLQPVTVPETKKKKK